MVMCNVRFCVLLLLHFLNCDGLFSDVRSYELESRSVPFPTCQVDDIECLRRGLRTFFFLMDEGHLGMKPVDPIIVNSVTVAVPEQQISILLRNLNVTGARWTKLIDRKFGLKKFTNTAILSNDLHVTGDIILTIPENLNSYVAYLTMDIQGAQSNITYSWKSQRGIDNYDYIVLGQERVAVRNTRTPSYFLQPNSTDAMIIERTLQAKQAIVDYLSNEITASLIHTIADNFRLFARTVPVHMYYKLYDNN